MIIISLVNEAWMVLVEVALHASINAEIVLLRIPAGTIIIVVAAAIRGVVSHDEVVVESRVAGLGARQARRHVRQVRLAIPTVECAMVRGLAAAVEDEVMPEVMAAAKTVIEINHGARTVEE